MTEKQRWGWLRIAVATAGTTVQAAATYAAAPANVANAPAWLGPLGVAAGAIAGLGVNLVSGAIERRKDARDAARDLQANEHLQRAQARAIAECLAEFAERDPLGRREFAELGETAEAWWLRFVSEGLSDLEDTADRKIAGVLADELVGKDPKPPITSHEWAHLLGRAHAEASKPTLRKTLADQAGDMLEREFVRRFFDQIKTDLRTGGEAFASIVLRFLSEILIEVRSIGQRQEELAKLQGTKLDELGTSLTKVEPALRAIVEAAAALKAIASLPDEVRTGLKDIERVVHDELAAVRPAIDETLRLVREIHAARRRESQRPPFHRLPPATVGRLIGRDAPLATLVERLHRRRHSDVWGPPGMGKTALAAEAVRRVVGESDDELAKSPYADGVVVLDMYRLRGDRERAWGELAASFDPDEKEQNPEQRARNACRGRRALVVVEGAEELGAALHAMLDVLSSEAVRLILTREKDQTSPGRIELDEELSPEEAIELLRAAATPACDDDTLRGVHRRLGGHPLALTWAGAELGAETQAPAAFLAELDAAPLPALHDPQRADHTLRWLFDRTVRRASGDARAVLDVLGRLAHAPVPLGAAEAAFEGPASAGRAREAVKELVRRALLRLAEGEREAWQFTHVLAYQYARSREGTAPPDSKRLTIWCLAEIEAALAEARGGAGHGSVGAATRHADALLRARRDSPFKGRDLMQRCLYDVCDSLLALGDLGLAKVAVGAAGAWLDSLPAEIGGDDHQARERSVVHNKLGDLALAQGDLAAARAAFETALGIRKKLAASDPSNAQRQRDLSVSHNQLGVLALAQGDLAAARTAFEAALGTAKKLAASDPSNAQRQRDLSVSHNQLGVLALAQGDLAAARAAFEAALGIGKKLAASDPRNAQWQRDLSVSHEKLGGLALAQGDLAAARAAFEAALGIGKKLAASDPSNAEWQRDLAVSCSSLASVCLRERDADAARPHLQMGFDIASRLAALDASNAVAQKDLAWFRSALAKLDGPTDRP